MMTVVLMVLVSCEGGDVRTLLVRMLRVPLDPIVDDQIGGDSLDRMLDDPLVVLVVLGLMMLI